MPSHTKKERAKRGKKALKKATKEVEARAGKRVKGVKRKVLTLTAKQARAIDLAKTAVKSRKGKKIKAKFGKIVPKKSSRKAKGKTVKAKKSKRKAK